MTAAFSLKRGVLLPKFLTPHQRLLPHDYFHNSSVFCKEEKKKKKSGEEEIKSQ